MSAGPFPTGIAPWCVVADTSGQYVYAANALITSSNISAFTMDATTGSLTPVTGSPFPAGSNPFGMAIVKIPQVAALP